MTTFLLELLLSKKDGKYHGGPILAYLMGKAVHGAAEYLVTLTGTLPMTLAYSLAKPLHSLTQYGACELREPPAPPVPQDCLTFSSASTFTLATANSTKNWDGTLETSTDGSTWATWDGTSAVSSSNDGKLYVRGSGNTKITGSTGSNARWVLTGSNISCNGDIRTLLSYADKASTAMASSCFSCLFYNCESLVAAPALPATTLKTLCYNQMFYGCANLVTAPALPATTLATSCYNAMFWYCTNLKFSTTQNADYPTPYQTIPYGGDTSQTPASQASANNMFAGTSGTFTGTPDSNTMYYLHKDNSIVPAS